MESNKQERSNLLNDNPIAARAGGSWISKHSIAAGSPLHQGGSYKQSPLEQKQYEHLEFTPTSTGDIRGGSVELTGTATIPGKKAKAFSSDPSEAKKQKQYWIDNPELKIKHDLAKADVTVTRERAINTNTKLFPNPDITKNDSLPAEAIIKTFKDKNDLPGYNTYLEKYGYTKKQKPTKKTKQNLTKFAYKVSE